MLLKDYYWWGFVYTVCIIHVNKYQINFYYVLFLMLYNNETEYFFFLLKTGFVLLSIYLQKGMQKMFTFLSACSEECVLQQLHFTQKGKGLVILFPRK